MALVAALALAAPAIHAQKMDVTDLPTRSAVTERLLAIAPADPKAVVFLLAGGPGRVRITNDGQTKNENFLVRSRQLFVATQLVTVVVDVPTDQPEGMTVAFRESSEHVADLIGAIAWARARWPGRPVWLVGTSRGTQSAAAAAVALANDTRGPDGIVLTSSILARSPRDPGTPVQERPLDKLKIPVLVVHHQDDPCPICAPRLLSEVKLPPGGRIVMETGGTSTGDPCQSFSHHGYNGIEGAVVADIAAFITGH
jgi:hypothetical protein